MESQEGASILTTWLWPLVFFLAGGFLLWWASFLFRIYQRAQYLKLMQTTRVLLIKVPQHMTIEEGEKRETIDFREVIARAEQLFAGLHTLSEQQTWKQLKGKEFASFEIVRVENEIRFYVLCPVELQPLVERAIHSTFPESTIEAVPNPNIFSGGQAVAAAEFGLVKSFVYPLRTYTTLEADPLTATLTAFTKLPGAVQAALQLVVVPAHHRWQFKTTRAAQAVMSGRGAAPQPWYVKTLTGAVEGLQKPAPPAPPPNAPLPLSAAQEATVQSFQQKGSKIGFKVAMRIVTAGPDESGARAAIETLIAPFAQYASPQLNQLKITRPRQPGHLVVDYITRKAGKMILNAEELASLWHLPNRYTQAPAIAWSSSLTIAPPATLPAEGIILGQVHYRSGEQLVRLPRADRRRHLFVIGKTGVGKTTLFLSMLEQDLKSAAGICFIDPLGDAAWELLGKIPEARQQDVVYLDPSDIEHPFGLNLLEWHVRQERDFLISEWIEIFYKLFDPTRTGIIGPQWEHWGRNAALTVMEQPSGGTLIDIPRLFTDDAFRARAIQNVTDPIVRAFWEEQLAKTADFHKSEMYNYFISKFGRFMTNDLMRNIIGQPRTSVNLRELMDSGKILIVNLAKGKIGETNAQLLGLILVSKLQAAAFSRANIAEEERRDFYLYVDEFQNVTTDTFATILSEARKYRLNLTITNQYVAQLSETVRNAVIGNVGTLLSFRIGAADAELIAKELPGVHPTDLEHLDFATMYGKILMDGTPTPPFSMKTLKSPTPVDSALRENIVEFVRAHYTHPRSQVEQAFRATMGQDTSNETSDTRAAETAELHPLPTPAQNKQPTHY